MQLVLWRIISLGELILLVLYTGYMNVMSDFPGSKKWVSRWCVVKEGRFDCHQESGEKVEFSIGLDDTRVELGEKETKRELAFKLVRNGVAKVFLEVNLQNLTLSHEELEHPLSVVHALFFIQASSIMEHGKWMKALINETNMVSGADYDDVCFDNGLYEDADNIYDEVRDPKYATRSANDGEWLSLHFSHRNHGYIQWM